MRSTSRTTVSLAALVTVMAFSSVGAQAPASHPMKEAKPGLLAKAHVMADAARKTALDAVKGGAIKEEEIEEEHGRLVFSFDIKVPGKRGVEEVQVDAQTGAVVSHEHESPAEESAEAAKERKERKERTEKRSAKGADTTKH